MFIRYIERERQREGERESRTIEKGVSGREINRMLNLVFYSRTMPEKICFSSRKSNAALTECNLELITHLSYS